MPDNIGHVTTVRMPIEQLKPADYNPRVMNDKQREGLSNSINSFGLLQPIIWNKRTGNVVGGHQRLYDIIGKGAKETDVVVVDFDEATEKAANIALNHSGIGGDYDDDKLQELLGEMSDEIKLKLNFDELLLPEWEPLTKVEKGEYDDIAHDKLIIKVFDVSLTSEVREAIQKVLTDHFTEEQVVIG